MRSTKAGSGDFRDNLSVTTHRRLRSHWAVLASAGYARDTSPLFFVSFPEVRSTAEARLVPVALGLRYSPLGENAKAPQPSLEIAPALYWYHYEASVQGTRIFTGGTSYASDSFDRVAWDAGDGDRSDPAGRTRRNRHGHLLLLLRRSRIG